MERRFVHGEGREGNTYGHRLGAEEVSLVAFIFSKIGEVFRERWGGGWCGMEFGLTCED